MPLTITQVDSFTDTPFAGNPAAVCLLPEPAADAWMQHVAREMNLSETAFLVRRDDGFDLRWFTPSVEVDLCGHATLAAAHVLWESGELRADQQMRFHTASGLLTCDKDGGWIYMDFPSTPAQAAEAPPVLLQGLGVPLSYAGKSVFDYLVEVESACCPARGTPSRGRRAGADPRLRAAEERRRSRRNRHQQGVDAGLRLRFALLCAWRGHRRGPGDGFGALLPRAVLAGAPRQGRDAGIPGISPWWYGASAV